MCKMCIMHQLHSIQNFASLVSIYQIKGNGRIVRLINLETFYGDNVEPRLRLKKCDGKKMVICRSSGSYLLLYALDSNMNTLF